MANANAPAGLRPVRYLSGAPYNGAVNAYSIPSSDSTAVCIGDLVKFVGTSQTINGVVYADVARAATGDVFVGAVVGVLPITSASTPYREASTQRVLLVADDPSLLFEAQEITGGTAFTANDIGLNCNIVVAAGSTVTGNSGTGLDNSTEATTNTLDVRIWGLANRADNAPGDSAKYLVKINRSAFANQIAGV